MTINRLDTSIREVRGFEPLRAHSTPRDEVLFYRFGRPRRGDAIRAPPRPLYTPRWGVFLQVRASPQGGCYSSPSAPTLHPAMRCFFTGSGVPAGGMQFDPLRAHSTPRDGVFFYRFGRPRRGDAIRAPPRTPDTPPQVENQWFNFPFFRHKQQVKKA